MQHSRHHKFSPVALQIPLKRCSVLLLHILAMANSIAFRIETMRSHHGRFHMQCWLRPKSIVIDIQFCIATSKINFQRVQNDFRKFQTNVTFEVSDDKRNTVQYLILMFISSHNQQFHAQSIIQLFSMEYNQQSMKCELSSSSLHLIINIGKFEQLHPQSPLIHCNLLRAVHRITIHF